MPENEPVQPQEPEKRPRGRPKGSKNKPKPVIYKKNRGRPMKDHRPSFKEFCETVEMGDQVPPFFKCTCCGKIVTHGENAFFKNPNAVWYEGNDGFTPICQDCLRKLFEKFKRDYNEKLSLLFCCAMTGRYFAEELYEQMVSQGQEISLGIYFRVLNTNKYKGKTYFDYLKEHTGVTELFMSPDQRETVHESKWSSGDRRNKAYAIQAVGYDPFDTPTYSSEDRRFLYNTLASYLSDEVTEDPHKVVCVIGLVQNLWQIERITRIVNSMLLAPNPDEVAISKMTSTKKDLQDLVNKTAKENAISASGSGKKQTSNTSLSSMMKAMLNDGFDDVKANMISAQMTNTYKTISELSAKALCNEMSFTGDEYAKMVAEQAETIQKQDTKLLEQEEEIRLLKVELSKKNKDKAADVVELDEDGVD